MGGGDGFTHLIGKDVGGCRVEALLGSGGMGTVYRARQLRLERPVAVKVLDARFAADEQYRRRFLLEARTAAALEHPNVVTVYDAGEADGVLYIVFQLVRGGDLAKYTLGRTLSPGEAVAIALAVARALAAAWAEGIVHLDIKPQNVLRGERGDWKVADFGIARRVDAWEGAGTDRPARTSEVAGTPPYMPPEQWRGDRVDGRTDLYALGTCLYEMIAGRLPYDLKRGAGTGKWYAAIVKRKPPPVPIEEVVQGVPAPLASLVWRLLAADPDARPSSAAAVIEELEPLVASLREAPAPAAASAAGREAPPRPVEAERAARPAAPPASGPASSAPSASVSASASGSGSAADTGSGLAPPSARVLGDENIVEEPLRAAFRSAREGRGRAIVYSGPAGWTGRDLLRGASVVAEGLGGAVFPGRVRPDRPLAAPREVLRRLFALDRREDDGATRRERLRLGLARLAGGEGVAQALRVLEPLLLQEADVSPRPDASLTPSFLAGLVARSARPARPAVVLLEGLHHADRATVEFAVALAAAAAADPLFLVATVAEGPAGRDVAGRLTAAGEGVVDIVSLRAAAAADTVEPSVPRGRTSEERALVEARELRALYDHAGAIATLDGALAALDDRAPRAVAARLRLELARSLRMAGERLEEAAHLGRSAVDAALGASDRRLAAEAALEGALALHLLRRHEPALVLVDEGASLLDAPRPPGGPGEGAAGPDPAARILEAELLHARGIVLARLGGQGDERATREAFDRALRLAAATGDEGLYARVAQSTGEALLRFGDLDGAKRLFALSAHYKQLRGDLAGLAMAYGGLARVARRRGDPSSAAAWFGRDLAVALQAGDQRGIGVAANGLGEAAEEIFLTTADPDALARAEGAYAMASKAARRSLNAIDQAIAAFYYGRFLCRCRGDEGRRRGIALLERARSLFLDERQEPLAQQVEQELARARPAPGT